MLTQSYEELQHFLPMIKQLSHNHTIDKSNVLTEEFLMESDENLEMYFSPHNIYINPHARIVIVGITPGWTQMREAFQQATSCVRLGDSIEELILKTKGTARFAGTMRKNLIEMLDACEVHSIFGLNSSSCLFEQEQNMMHTTSLIKYPVYVNGRNYTGYAPKINQSTLLKNYAYLQFPQELNEIKNDFLFIPLGKAVTEVIEDLINKRVIKKEYCLLGFPHPSGANGHRKKQFAHLESRFRKVVHKFGELELGNK